MIGNRLARVALALASALLGAAPFAIAWHLATAHRDVAEQVSTAAVTLDPADVQRWTQQAASLPATAAPVVLAYHDIRPLTGATAADLDESGQDHYVVSPQQFDAQLSALEAAGYRTLSTDGYLAYLHGGPTPARSVYLTFDDGTQGLWKYADPILRRHHMVAASYLISGRVGTHQPYYLTWAEVERMAGSGRWDFQAHTHDLHTRVDISADRLGSPLTNRQYDRATGRTESMDDFRQRVDADFAALFADFSSHHLPRPQLFAYPFSEVGDSQPDAQAAAYSQQLIATDFAASLTNKSAQPQPSSRRAAAGGQVDRAEVYATTTPAELVSEVLEWTARPASVTDAFAQPWDWRDQHQEPATTLAPFTTGVADPASPTYAYAALRPYSSADWSNYTVAADVRGLRAGNMSATVLVRVDSDATVSVRVSNSELELLVGQGVVAVARTAASATHHVEVRVSDGQTAARVDGGSWLTIPNAGGPATTGGVGVAINDTATGTRPAFTALTVTS